jgi:hypothetical protein
MAMLEETRVTPTMRVSSWAWKQLRRRRYNQPYVELRCAASLTWHESQPFPKHDRDGMQWRDAMAWRWVTTGVAALGFALIAGVASATTITGTLNFGPGTTNYYDPANGQVPPGYSNESSPTVTLEPDATFGYADLFNIDTAGFTPTSLVLTDDTLIRAGNWTQTFAASTPGFFNDISLTSDTLGVSYSVSGDTLTVNWPGTDVAGTRAADFTFSGGVPEPTTWAMLILGVAMIGFAARRRNAGVAVAA